ncbi:hypothetical protein ABMA58_15765 [Oceanospirillum sp. HFRX-1_2]
MWPLIADLYTPLLALLVCWVAYQRHYLKPAFVMLLVNIALVFAFSALEFKFGFWHSWGLDYSTHTAVLLPFYQMLLILPLLPVRDSSVKGSVRLPVKAFMALIVALVSGIGYGILMMQLGYHTFADILTTLISTYPLVWICFHLLGFIFRQSPQVQEVT